MRSWGSIALGLALAPLASLAPAAPPTPKPTSAADEKPAMTARPASYQVSGDRIEQPLDGLIGDPDRGREIVSRREIGMCVLCHRAPVGDERSQARQQGDIAGDLAGAGRRWTAAQLRLRVVDARRLHPDSLMPAFHRTEGLTRVADGWKDRPVLTAQQVEDVVAYLRTLKD